MSDNNNKKEVKDKTFMKISNKDIYDSIQKLDKKIDSLAPKVKFNTWAVGVIISIIIGLIIAIINIT